MYLNKIIAKKGISNAQEFYNIFKNLIKVAENRISDFIKKSVLNN